MWERRGTEEHEEEKEEEEEELVRMRERRIDFGKKGHI